MFRQLSVQTSRSYDMAGYVTNRAVPSVKYTEFRRMVSSGLLRRVAPVRTDVSEEPGASFIRVTKIGELGTTQGATSN
jgi:hypothetical protein